MYSYVRKKKGSGVISRNFALQIPNKLLLMLTTIALSFKFFFSFLSLFFLNASIKLVLLIQIFYIHQKYAKKQYIYTCVSVYPIKRFICNKNMQICDSVLG